MEDKRGEGVLPMMITPESYYYEYLKDKGEKEFVSVVKG